MAQEQFTNHPNSQTPAIQIDTLPPLQPAPLSQQGIDTDIAISNLQVRGRRKRFSALVPKPEISPNAYSADPQVLSRTDISIVHEELAEHDPKRLALIDPITAGNVAVFTQSERIAVFLDGRSVKKGQTVLPDGWWGDTIEASSIIHTLLAAGKAVDIYSNQPSIYGKKPGDNVTLHEIPFEVAPFQFYPYRLPFQPSSDLMNFLETNQADDMAFLFPLNARMPVLLKFVNQDGFARLSPESEEVVDLVRRLIGQKKERFSGITGIEWSQIGIHQTQALQVMTELIGIDTSLWTEFPKPYLHPSTAARALAQEIVSLFTPDSRNKIQALFHIGRSLNYPGKSKKEYPLTHWNAVLDTIAKQDQTGLIGTIILFEPLNPEQAESTRELAQHAREVYGEERVLLVPLRQTWNLSALVALTDELANNGIIVSIDSAPAHIGARRIPVDEVGNRAFDPNHYVPEGAMVILPSTGQDAQNVNPNEVAAAFMYLAQKIMQQN